MIDFVVTNRTQKTELRIVVHRLVARLLLITKHYGLSVVFRLDCEHYRLCHAKEYNQRFEKYIIYMGGYLLFITRLDVNVVETLIDIEFGKVVGLLKLSNQFRDW